MIGQSMIDRLYDCQVVDPRGEKIGSVKQVWLDGQTGEPVWASVHTGLFGLRETFVPLQRAELHDGQVQVPVAK
ncbi:MAG TPA: PRC-barrel domain-containing protein [Actinophytocola sp.]|jgi:sporulation protein YlmC with PRC-barrel domain|nr:PRC-barrel domain-containing protein [Actinophytocola sp.]